MCVHYTNLNKVCPKDSCPLPSIDRLVHGASNFYVLNFLDAYPDIKANPDKCEAIINMKIPQNMKEIQRLIGRLVSLSWFLPKAAKRDHLGPSHLGSSHLGPSREHPGQSSALGQADISDGNLA
ncbi:hypothetical protein CR513_53635, partial [Mucuna pruriens]